jgi:hypothetical protein
MQADMGRVPQTSTPRGFFRSLLDLSFSSFITLGIVKVLYVISLVLVLLYALLLGVSAASGAYGLVGIPELGGSPALGVMLGLLVFLVLFPLVLIIGAIYVRVLLELVVVLFRIAENTGELVRQGQLSPAAGREGPAASRPREDLPPRGGETGSQRPTEGFEEGRGEGETGPGSGQRG